MAVLPLKILECGSEIVLKCPHAAVAKPDGMNVSEPGIVCPGGLIR
jgi:hypothetical protein